MTDNCNSKIYIISYTKQAIPLFFKIHLCLAEMKVMDNSYSTC